MPVVDKMLEKTWKAPLAAGYNGELQAVVNNLTLKHLLALAANEKASPSVRGEALLKVDELQQWMTATAPKAEARQKANIMFGLAQIGKYRENPEKFLTPAASVMPPGAPIGMPAIDFLNDDLAY